MNLGKYIRQLLTENETVIIPGFGAFISEYKPAQFDDVSGEINPPSKTISFNAKIKNNDGLLAGFIAQKEQIPVRDALAQIEIERDEMLYKLDKGEQVILDSTGVLKYDENREIQFKPEPAINLLTETFGLEKIGLEDEPEETPEEKTEKIEPAVVPENKEDSTENETEKPEEKKEPEGVKKSDPYSKYKPAEPNSDKFKEKKKRGWMWFLLLLIPIIAAGIYLLQKDKKEPPKPVEVKIRPVKKEEQPMQATDSMVADSVVADTTFIQPADTLKPEELISNFADYMEPDTTKFYVIGGSFENAENAEKYLQRMKKEGYTPFHLGKQGSFYLVGLEIHDNEIEAYGAQYNFLDKHPDSGVWVFIPE
jgi:nucleoid DNA-binding protein/cell division septation protein DedD